MKKSRRHIAIAALVGMMALAITVGVVASVLPSGPVPNTPAVAAITANVAAGRLPWDGLEQVLYVQRVTSGSGEGQAQTEVWADVGGNRARIVTRNDGTLMTDNRVTADTFLDVDYDTRGGKPRASTRDVSNADGWQLTYGPDRIWPYERFFSRGLVEVLGETVVDGRPALRLRLMLETPEEPADQDQWMEARMDKATRLPLEMVKMVRLDDGTVQTQLLARYRYLRIAFLSQDEVPSDNFDTSVPSATAEGQSLDYWTMADARLFTDFDVYYLGETFQDLEVQEIWYSQRPAGDDTPLLSVVTVWYKPIGRDNVPQNELVEVGSFSRTAWNAVVEYAQQHAPPANSEIDAVQVKPGTVEDGHAFVSQGTSLVRIRGGASVDAAAIQSMVDALQQVN